MFTWHMVLVCIQCFVFTWSMVVYYIVSVQYVVFTWCMVVYCILSY